MAKIFLIFYLTVDYTPRFIFVKVNTKHDKNDNPPIPYPGNDPVSIGRIRLHDKPPRYNNHETAKQYNYML